MTETPQRPPDDPRAPGSGEPEGRHDPRSLGKGARADYVAPDGSATASDESSDSNDDSGMSSYAKLAIALSISLILMWILSMSMVREIDHFFFNLSNFYMAVIMVAPMGLVMIGVMWAMFKNKRLNLILIAFFIALFGGALALGRTETFVGNEQFLKGMIPHHSRAILVCQESDITDPQIKKLCEEIIATQREEIDEMKEILERY